VSTIDLDTRRPIATDSIAQNEIGLCTLKLARPTAVERYADCKETGSFILIDPESYDTVGMGCVETVFALSRPTIVAAAPAPAEPAPAAKGVLAHWTETHLRSLTKAVSWRATGSLDTFAVAWVITGSPKLAGSVAVTEILTKIVIYYFHERIWAWVPWGKRSAQSTDGRS